ncbi:MAG: helix-turn-helix domain-containing protein [Candidatus Aminicenantales bacterium]
MGTKPSKTIFTKDHINLIERLKKARIEAGFDQGKVAQLLGETQSYISKIESGQRRIDVVQLKRFSEVYKKPIEYFIDK